MGDSRGWSFMELIEVFGIFIMMFFLCVFVVGAVSPIGGSFYYRVKFKGSF